MCRRTAAQRRPHRRPRASPTRVAPSRRTTTTDDDDDIDNQYNAAVATTATERRGWSRPVWCPPRRAAPPAACHHQRRRVLVQLSLQSVRCLTRAVARIFFSTEATLAGPRTGVGSRFSQPPPRQLWGVWGSAVNSPSGIRSGAPAAKRFSCVLTLQSGLSRQFSVVYCSLQRKNFFLIFIILGVNW